MKFTKKQLKALNKKGFPTPEDQMLFGGAIGYQQAKEFHTRQQNAFKRLLNNPNSLDTSSWRS